MRKQGGPIVAIDTHTLIWGIRQVGSEEQNKKAKWLFARLDEDGAQVIVPAVALSEYLTPIPFDLHKRTIASISGEFLVAPFDIRCASLAAHLFNAGRHVRPMGLPDARKSLRADCLIVATAAMHGARVIYSDDSNLRSLAKHSMPMIEGQPLPDIPPNLFEYPNEARGSKRRARTAASQPSRRQTRPQRKQT